MVKKTLWKHIKKVPQSYARKSLRLKTTSLGRQRQNKNQFWTQRTNQAVDTTRVVTSTSTASTIAEMVAVRTLVKTIRITHMNGSTAVSTTKRSPRSIDVMTQTRRIVAAIPGLVRPLVTTKNNDLLQPISDPQAKVCK